MPGSAFYDLDGLQKIAVNLFYGWGYNFYRLENQLRADDQLVRAQVGALLGRARGSVEMAESAYRREFLLPPSRAKPYPEPEAVAGAQTLERLAHAIGALAGQVSAQPVPEKDRMNQRYRQEAATLASLLQIDEKLVGQAEMLRAMLADKDAAWLLGNASHLTEGMQAISGTLQERANLLLA